MKTLSVATNTHSLGLIILLNLFLGKSFIFTIITRTLRRRCLPPLWSEPPPQPPPRPPRPPTTWPPPLATPSSRRSGKSLPPSSAAAAAIDRRPGPPLPGPPRPACQVSSVLLGRSVTDPARLCLGGTDQPARWAVFLICRSITDPAGVGAGAAMRNS
jgi:hypothetical protein